MMFNNKSILITDEAGLLGHTFGPLMLAKNNPHSSGWCVMTASWVQKVIVKVGKMDTVSQSGSPDRQAQIDKNNRE